MNASAGRSSRRSCARQCVPIPLWQRGSMLLCLLWCAACAAPTVQYIQVERCSVPTARLAQTQEPELRDKTNGDLLLEIDGPGGWLEALRSCNRDKADVQRLIEHTNQQSKEGAKR